MPRGSGIYEDEPREHRHSYSTDSTNEHEPDHDPTPDDSASKDAGEPTG